MLYVLKKSSVLPRIRRTMMILTEVGTVSKDCFYNRKWSRNRLQTRRQYKERLTRYNPDSDKFLTRRNNLKI